MKGPKDYNVIQCKNGSFKTKPSNQKGWPTDL